MVTFTGEKSMFTGIVEAFGKVLSVHQGRDRSAVLEIEMPKSFRDLKKGSSVCVEGACLTLVRRLGRSFYFYLLLETCRRTKLGSLRKGDRVNLERALKRSGRIEGHFVQGHVDGVGTIRKVISKGREKTFQIHFPENLALDLVQKGSVAVDGVSLTIGRIEKDAFRTHCIPHTLKHTTLGFRKVGERVNLEADILIKSLRNLL